jgi:hypothetical protein
MAWYLFLSLSALCVGMILRGLVRAGRPYHFPFLAAATFFFFILPQAPGLMADRFTPDGAAEKTLLMGILCLGACGIGWGYGVNRTIIPRLRFNETRLLQAAAVLSLIGAYFFHKVGQLPDDERLRGAYTGAAVAYLFFAKLLTYGFALALLCFARRASVAAFVVIAGDCLLYFDRIVIAGRRSEAAEFLLLIALAFWFHRRWTVPRVAMVAGILAGIVAMLGAEQYRQATFYTTTGPDWSAVRNIDLAENWKQLIRNGGPELRNAAQVIDHADKTKEFDYGLAYWNLLVFTFVPAQVIGPEAKYALYLPTPDLYARGYEPSSGSTATGLADAFLSFGYFGCAKFFLVAAILGAMYAAAIRGSTPMQLLYMLSVVPAMLTVSHFTGEPIIAWIHMAAFLGPVLLYARMRGTTAPQPRPALRWTPDRSQPAAPA